MKACRKSRKLRLETGVPVVVFMLFLFLGSLVLGFQFFCFFGMLVGFHRLFNSSQALQDVGVSQN